MLSYRRPPSTRSQSGSLTERAALLYPLPLPCWLTSSTFGKGLASYKQYNGFRSRIWRKYAQSWPEDSRRTTLISTIVHGTKVLQIMPTCWLNRNAPLESGFPETLRSLRRIFLFYAVKFTSLFLLVRWCDLENVDYVLHMFLISYNSTPIKIYKNRQWQSIVSTSSSIS